MPCVMEIRKVQIIFHLNWLMKAKSAPNTQNKPQNTLNAQQSEAQKKEAQRKQEAERQVVEKSAVS